MPPASPDEVVARGPRAWPLWARALATYVLLRLLLVPAFLWAWQRQGPNRSSYPDAPPDLLTFLALSWDGSWYHQIALNGYPLTLPTDPATGAVLQNPWAFFPLFPFLVRAAMAITGLPFAVVSPAVSFLAGAVAMVLVAVLVRDAAAAAVRSRPGLPLLAVAALSAYPAAATAMVGYSETTALALIAASLLLIHRRRYWWAMLPVVGLGFTRAVALPMLAVVIWHWLQRLRAARAAGTRLEAGASVRLGLLALVAGLSGVAWPWLAGLVTGVPNAYLRTQAAWRFGEDAAVPFVLFARKLDEWTAGAGLAVTLLAVVVVVGLSLTPPARRLGPELQAWGGAYLVYLLALADLGSSIVRFALLSITVPLALVAWSRRRWLQLACVAALLALQVAWITVIWVFGGRGDPFPP